MITAAGFPEFYYQIRNKFSPIIQFFLKPRDRGIISEDFISQILGSSWIYWLKLRDVGKSFIFRSPNIRLHNI